MDKSVIKIGTRVKWSGAWNTDPHKEVYVEGIQKCKEKHEKYGDNVEEISWEDKDYGVFDLSNGHWCYGNQIHDIVSQPDDEPEEIEVRITWRSEIYIKGKNIDEIRDKWEDTGLFSADALELNADFVELVSAERVDDDSYDEIDI